MAASFFTEDYRLGAVSGAAGSCGRETGSIKELSLLRALLSQSELDEMIFGMKTCPAREIGYDSSADAEPPAIPGKRATSFLPFFLLLPALVAVGRSAHCF